MNLLPFVMTLFMLLTALTYQRLSTFKSRYASTIAREQYLQTEKWNNLHKSMRKKFEDMHVTEKEGGKGTKPVKASSKLSLPILFSPEKKPEKYQVYRQLFKALVKEQLKEQKFYQELLQEQPAILDAFLDALPKTKVKLKKNADLVILDFDDPKLNELHYRLMKKGSLADLVTIKNYDHIRLYLASKPLLTAIYESESIATAIIHKREEIYRSLGENSIEEANGTFRLFCEQFPTSHVKYLNFEVSQTDPHCY